MKKTLTLAAVLIAAVFIINLVDRLAKRQGSPDLLKGFKKEAVTQISVSQGVEKEILKKAAGKWITTAGVEYPADTTKIRELLDLLAVQKKGKAASKNPAKHSMFKVDTTEAIKMEVVSGGKSFAFFVGGPSQGWTGNYFRFDGQNEVYVTQGTLERLCQSKANYYRDKTLIRLNKDNINDFNVSYKDIQIQTAATSHKSKKPPSVPRQDTTITVKEIEGKFDIAKGSWRIEKPQSADGDPAQFNEYLSKFTGLEVEDWYDLDPAAVTGFESPFLTATLRTSDGSIVVLVAGNEKDGRRFVKVEGDPNKYLVQSWRIDQLKKNWEELKKKEAAPTDLNQPPLSGLPGSQD